MPTTSTSTNRRSQLKRLAKHLADGMSISPLEAQKVYGIERLAARIYDLKQIVGVNIASEPRFDALGKRYVRYSVPGLVGRAMLENF